MRDSRAKFKTEHSWQKHSFLRKPIYSQACAFRVSALGRSGGRILLIDGNAGDGIGVEKEQGDLFEPTLSEATPAILMGIAEAVGNCDVVLCEKNKARRVELMHNFPNAIVLINHREALKEIKPAHRFVLYVADPCGLKDMGVEHMRAVNQCAIRQGAKADFVLVLNEGAVENVRGLKADTQSARTSHARYDEWLKPEYWFAHFNKRWIARSVRIDQSPRFRYRILVISDWIAREVQKTPWTVDANPKFGRTTA